jgi:secondary thiamine-phosphate synthase enzyme
MRQATGILVIETKRQGLLEITTQIAGWVGAQRMGVATSSPARPVVRQGPQPVSEGLLTIFCRHTSASLLIQENAAREVRTDLEAYFARIAPEDPDVYDHDDEGPDDMPAHIRTALTHVQLSIPVIDGRLALGTWQGIYLFEHRRRPHSRSLALHLIGEAARED